MSNDLAKTNQPTPMDLMQSMIEKGVEPETLEKMLDLQERWQANEAHSAFSNAMADFQARCPTIKKTKSAGRGITYAPLDEILRTIRPHLNATGLSVSFSTEKEDTERVVVCTVSHRDGHSERSDFPLHIDPEMRVNETQKVGSANSYAKRYALGNALNLVTSDDDDDGYAAGLVVINDEQVKRLNTMITDIETVDVPAYLKYLGVSAIEDIPEHDYQRAFKALERKAQA